jgi:hypothetical protein
MFYIYIVLIYFKSVSDFSLGNQISSTNKTDRHDITEILLKVSLNTINLTLTLSINNKIQNVIE